MNKILLASFAAVTATLSFTASAEDLLTGDARLACEATLCLSSGTRPGECAPSLNRYFSIKPKRLDDMIRARLNFLNLCPASQEPGMPDLIRAIAAGAGRCDAAELNRLLRTKIQVPNPQWTARQCHYFPGRRSCENISKTIEKEVIGNQRPNYCAAYHQHGWTQIGTRYVGQPEQGGRWVD